MTTLAAALAIALGGAVAFAHGSPTQAPQAQAPMPGQDMMQGGGMMARGGMMGGMDAAQMDRMMENCNRMMESRMQGGQQTPGAPGSPTPDKRG